MTTTSGRGEGMKFDGGKCRMELLPLDALEQVAWILTYGAEKYEPNSWQDVPEAVERYTGALLRHLKNHRKGRLLEKDTGLPHIAQVACNALFLVHFFLDQLPESYDFTGVREKFAADRAKAQAARTQMQQQVEALLEATRSSP